MKKIIVIIFVCLIISCQNEKQSNNCLIIPFNLEGKVTHNIDDLFGKAAQYTFLETSSESLIGKIGKIVKRNSCFFILSEDKQILQFNDEGKFISILDKLGNGPGEYTMITDFNIYTNNENETEIWLSDFSKLRKYQYINNSWNEFATIDYPYVINKFHIIDNKRLLLLTGQNDKCLTMSDHSGKEVYTYLKSEIPFMIFKPVQFIDFQSEIIFQMGVSNNCVRVSKSDNNFEETKILCEKKFISSENLLTLYTNYGYEYLGELSAYSYIRTLRRVKNQILVEYFTNNMRYVSVFTDNNGWKYISYHPKDINTDNNIFSLSTIGVGDSSENFILFKYSEDLDNNPIIVEY
jgi:hypothetical protein